jgi:hypothetical protein
MDLTITTMGGRKDRKNNRKKTPDPNESGVDANLYC